MRKRMSVLASLAITAGFVGGTGLVAGSSANAAVGCGSTGSKLHNATWANIFTANGVNIRTGPKVSCTSVGQAQKSHNATLYCSYYNGSYWWQWLKDVNTGKVGWVRTDNLAGRSPEVCYVSV